MAKPKEARLIVLSVVAEGGKIPDSLILSLQDKLSELTKDTGMRFLIIPKTIKPMGINELKNLLKSTLASIEL